MSRPRETSMHQIVAEWAEARQLLADAGMGDLSVAAAIATLLPPPVDEDELAASMARHPSARRRGHTITWTIECHWGVVGIVKCHEPPNAACHQETYPECNYITWIENADGWVEHYAGTDTPLTEGPIEFAWNGDDWDWLYSEVDA